MHDDSNANKTETNKVDPNWRDDALNLELDYGMQTIAVRAGQHRTDEGEHSEAIFTTSSYVYESAVDAAAHLMVAKRVTFTRAIPIRACAPLSGVWRRSKTASVRWRQPQVWARF